MGFGKSPNILEKLIGKDGDSGTGTLFGWLKQIFDKQIVVDWSSKTLQTNLTTISHYANTALDITGSGYFIALNNHSTASQYASVQIDGGTIRQVILPGNGGSISLFPLRFNTSLLVKGSHVDVKAVVILD